MNTYAALVWRLDQVSKNDWRWFGSRLGTVLGLSLVMFAEPSLWGQESDGPITGTPWEGLSGISERTADIMAREEQAAHQPQRQHPPKIHPRLRPDFQNLANSPEAPVVTTWPPGATSTNLAVSQMAVVNFTGATLADTGAFPPDSMGVAGPAQFIVAVNGRIRSFDKTTGSADGVLNANTDVFFNSVMTPPTSNNFTSDPRIRYDRLSGRWFVIMIDVPGQAGTLPNRVMLAMSDGPVITSGTVWTFFYFQQDKVTPTGDTGRFADYPTLGIDANALYIGVNIFTAQGAFSNTTGFVVRKSSLLSGGPIVVTAFRGLINRQAVGMYTPQGVDNYDSAATEGYFIGVDAGFYGILDLRRISNPGGTPSMSANISITVPLNGATITVPHLGNTAGSNGYLDGLDYRLLAAHLRGGTLWTTANIAVDNTGSPTGTDTRMGVRWLQLGGIASGQTPTVLQAGTLFQPSASNTTDQRCYWMGTAMVSGQGHVALGFSVAGANEYINAGTAGRLANDPPGTLRTPTLYTATSTAYNPGGDPGGSRGRRWGDYSFTCLDPSDDMTMWTIQEFCDATGSYGVRVIKLLAPSPATPVSCSPASLTAGVTNIDVVLTGTSNGDTGFFDPGLGFSNRLAAAVSGSGDVTINRLSYTDPTHLTLNLSVSSAAVGGARTVTVTNPDGQSATSATGILSIVPWPSLSAIAVSGGTAMLTWTAEAGQTYRLGYKEDITAPTWTAVTPDVTASGPTTTLTNFIGSSTQRFYRVFLLP